MYGTLVCGDLGLIVQGLFTHSFGGVFCLWKCMSLVQIADNQEAAHMIEPEIMQKKI